MKLQNTVVKKKVVDKESRLIPRKDKEAIYAFLEES